MRTVFLLLLFASILVRTVGAPQAGVLGWAWLTLMQPQKLDWGFINNFQFNMILAIVTALSWVFSREPKRLPFNFAMVLWISFMALITFTTIVAVAPEHAWERWDRTIKVMALGFFVAGVMTNQVRIHALIWVIVLSLGFYGVKGGAFTLFTGAAGRVQGIEGSGLGDNNALGMALCLVLPLMNYLRQQSGYWLTRLGAAGAMGLTAMGILGTYSRGALVGLLITGAYLWWRSRQKLVIAIVGLALAVPAIGFMPAAWTERMQTIQNPEQDGSFQGRVEAWRFAFNVAVARPLMGAGFNGTEVAYVFALYNPTSPVKGLAAHSIYFEVLGDHGFIGLGLYLGMIVTAWLYASATRRRARGDPNLAWAADLAAMIQVCLLSFMVVGAALSMAYYDMFFLLVSVPIVLREVVLRGDVRTSPNLVPVKVGVARPAVVMPAVRRTESRALR